MRDVPATNFEWVYDAACKGLPSDLFFPKRTDHESEWAAKAVCINCPVRLLCLKQNLSEEKGIWGGTAPRDRRVIRRHLRGGISLSLSEILAKIDKRKPRHGRKT